jgi:thiol:disulfide interchange protein DsbD
MKLPNRVTCAAIVLALSAAACQKNAEPSSGAPAASTPAPPAAKQPVVWSGPAEPVTAGTGMKASVNLAATIAPGWHIYALTQAAGGPTPLEISMPESQPFKIDGAIASTEPEVKFDPGFNMDVHLLTGRAEFTVPVTVSKTTPGKQSMIVEARYQACNSSLCLPARTDRVDVSMVIK